MTSSPLDQSPVGQTDAVLPQDVGHGQRDAHIPRNITQPLVKLLKLLRRKTKEKDLGQNTHITTGVLHKDRSGSPSPTVLHD